MRLPRRTPFASLAELDELCSWIFADENDWQARTLALNRLAAWKAITTLPHALESTHAILSILVQDYSDPSRSQGGFSAQSFLPLRQSYATSIIRLVNGLVDPLQVGAYARSIASIAAQLGLPAWLVELRHAATHEDLPSLEILRGAANQSMNWLFHHYFLPTLNPTLPDPSTSTSTQPTLRPLEPLLKQYKTLLKIVTRDASLRTQYRPEIDKVERDMERWVAEAVVAADVASGEFAWGREAGVDGNGEDEADEVDGKERWALNKVCDALLEKGMLVPLSKKKRATQKSQFLPSPSTLAIWTPLLAHLTTHHPALPSTLIHRIISHLLQFTSSLSPSSTSALTVTKEDRDPSYDLYLASWVTWLCSPAAATTVNPIKPGIDVEDEREIVAQQREDAFVMLVSGLGPGAVSHDSKTPSGDPAHILLKALCTSDARLADILEQITAAPMEAPSLFASDSVQSWTEDAMTVMDDRLRSILSSSSPSPYETTESRDPDEPMAGVETIASKESQAGLALGLDLPKGWSLMDEKRWRACPIGVFVSYE